MSKSRLLLSFASVFASAALIIGATVAFFSDTETSANNLLEAGKIDLKIDNTSYYNGAFNQGTSWSLADLDDGQGPSGNGAYLFFNFNDIKPSDYGEDTISLHVEDNPCWICAEVKLTSNDDNGSTDPEKLDETPYTDGVGNGELAAKINFLWWADDGDNVLEVGETSLPVGGPIGDLGVGNTATIALADSTASIWSPSPSPFPGGEDKFIGKAWCFGQISTNPLNQDGVGNVRNPSLDNNNDQTVNSADGGFTCDGSQENNETQTDSLTLDVVFKAIQARNNPNFVCGQALPSPTPSILPSPTPGPCNEQPDVMLVLDRSGSINSTELGQLKTAAKSFVDALAPTAPTAHVGFSSFSTTATLNHHLSADGTSVKNAIDLLTSSGLTNLQGGINLANTELGGGDGHDRADGTSPDFMVIITDGNPNEPGTDTTARNLAAAAADAARTAGTVVYVLGVGGDVDTAYLQTEIADDLAHYFSVANFSDLSAVLNDIANCPE